MKSVHEIAEGAKKASRVLAPLGEDWRNKALEAMAKAVLGAKEELLAANAEDLKTAAAMQASGELSGATIERLNLDEGKLAEMVAQIRSVAALPDPLGRKLDAVELDDADPGDVRAEAVGLRMEKVSVPLGVLAVIFEARPDAVTQIAALALKSGNAVIMKPGREVERTAEALVRVLRGALKEQGLPEDAIALVLGREQVHELLGEHALVDMVIPRGSKALVEFVQANTRIPVLGHAEGVCHIYVDRLVDEEMALRVIADAKCDYPAACNAVETVLVHAEIAPTFLPKLAAKLRGCNVAIHAGSEHVEMLSLNAADSPDNPGGPQGGVDPGDNWVPYSRTVQADAQADAPADPPQGGVDPGDDWVPLMRTVSADASDPTGPQGGIDPGDDWQPPRHVHPVHGGGKDDVLPVKDWHTEYGELALSVGVVASLDEAIEHIHRHGSCHTESILTEDDAAAARFLQEVDAAGVFHNASTRFADGFRYGFGAEVGISTSKFHARGPVGLDGLTTYKYVLRGNGHVAGDYRGKDARAFTHRRADKTA